MTNGLLRVQQGANVVTASEAREPHTHRATLIRLRHAPISIEAIDRVDGNRLLDSLHEGVWKLAQPETRIERIPEHLRHDDVSISGSSLSVSL